MASGLVKVPHAIPKHLVPNAQWRDATHQENKDLDFQLHFKRVTSNTVQYTLYKTEVRNLKEIYEHAVDIFTTSIPFCVCVWSP
jgi:uncharacterized protein YbcV (DUF1398 family)